MGGSDVHCLFYKPAGEEMAMPDPKECFYALADHTSMTGRRFEVGYAAVFEAFMRRLKRADPAYDIYEAYAAEHTERWAGAKALSMAEAMAEMPEIERKYNGTYVAIADGAKVTEADVLTKSLEDFEANRDKAVDAVMATKLPALDKKK